MRYPTLHTMSYILLFTLCIQCTSGSGSKLLPYCKIHYISVSTFSIRKLWKTCQQNFKNWCTYMYTLCTVCDILCMTCKWGQKRTFHWLTVWRGAYKLTPFHCWPQVHRLMEMDYCDTCARLKTTVCVLLKYFWWYFCSSVLQNLRIGMNDSLKSQYRSFP